MKKNGFTMIEMIAIVIILGLIGLIATNSIKKVVRDSKLRALEATASQIKKAVSAECKMEKIDKKGVTSLYTIIDGKIDNDLVIKGQLPDNGYVLVQDNCKVAYTFYSADNVISKNFSESEPLVYNKENAPSYGLKWQSNKSTLDDTYTRTLDASDIDDDSVKVQVGEAPVTNAFDELDIYKDILPYTDEFGNEFMLIPKFYISKSKEVTDTEVIWNYAVSKHKLDDTYYLPSNFVDEGIDNNQHIELPYVLVGKYQGSSNSQSGDEEKLVSIRGLLPRVEINIDKGRTLSNRYNIDGINGYQQYDIHVNDLLTALFAIEFKTMNFQNILKGYVNKNSGTIVSGLSDIIKSSSGTLLNDGHNSFHYRGIENMWGNVWSFLDGINIDQTSGDTNKLFVSNNARLYSSVTKDVSYMAVGGFNKLDEGGFISELGFDEDKPFVNFPIKVNGFAAKGVGCFYNQNIDEEDKSVLVGGYWSSVNAGLISYYLNEPPSKSYLNVGTRLVKTPLK